MSIDWTIGVGSQVRVKGAAVDGVVELVVEDVAFISRHGHYALLPVLISKLVKSEVSR